MSDVTLTVEAQDGVTPYSYQWFFKDTVGGAYVAINAVDNGQPFNPTAVTASLVNHAVTTASSGTYKCEVTDHAANKITSVECLLTVA